MRLRLRLVTGKPEDATARRASGPHARQAVSAVLDAEPLFNGLEAGLGGLSLLQGEGKLVNTPTNVQGKRAVVDVQTFPDPSIV